MKSRPWFLPRRPTCSASCAVRSRSRSRASTHSPAGPPVTRTPRRRWPTPSVAGDTAKRDLLVALRAAFVTALEPEDLFFLSRGIDRILDSAREVINESQVLASPPDADIAEMARLIGRAMRHIDEAIAHLGTDGDRATAAADAAIAAERELDAVYYGGMAALLDVDERAARIGGRELYRRCARIGDIVVDVAERIVYAVVKQS